jgi:hypothetical protein
MKLERINAAAQIELPNARPLNRSQSVSNMSAPIPERKRMAQRIATDALAWRLCDRAPYDTCDSWVVWDLLIIAKSGGDPQNNSARNPARSDPARMPDFAALTGALSSNASIAINSDMVKPIPARQA